MYLTFAEYTSYGGTITNEATFTQYEFKARKLIDSLTANRVATNMTTISSAVKRSVFEVIKLEQIYDGNVSALLSGASGSSGGKLVASFSNDGYKETYATGASDTGNYLLNMRSNTTKAQEAVVSNLLAYEYDDDHVKLLYRGVH